MPDYYIVNGKKMSSKDAWADRSLRADLRMADWRQQEVDKIHQKWMQQQYPSSYNDADDPIMSEIDKNEVLAKHQREREEVAKRNEEIRNAFIRELNEGGTVVTVTFSRTLFYSKEEKYSYLERWKFDNIQKHKLDAPKDAKLSHASCDWSSHASYKSHKTSLFRLRKKLGLENGLTLIHRESRRMQALLPPNCVDKIEIVKCDRVIFLKDGVLESLYFEGEDAFQETLQREKENQRKLAQTKRNEALNQKEMQQHQAKDSQLLSKINQGESMLTLTYIRQLLYSKKNGYHYEESRNMEPIHNCQIDINDGMELVHPICHWSSHEDYLSFETFAFRTAKKLGTLKDSTLIHTEVRQFTSRLPKDSAIQVLHEDSTNYLILKEGVLASLWFDPAR